ncbi:hypothetical protein M3T53_03850 [Actinomyces sp. B33]|uniref:hypothetical protein n=1 Tax=Actinomyces sp. B33 TaxID=2942131 RepID=UPI0023414423|nr:hypothetical protein [Actinomyces sp. B33]MDC4232846.1 hypothetical protein [Actinomyces sp. B33]
MRGDRRIAWAAAGSGILIVGVVVAIVVFHLPWHVLPVGLMVLAGQWTGLLVARRSSRGGTE